MSTNIRLFIATTFFMGFWTIILASNPPLNGGTAHWNAEVLSLGARRFLPCALAMVAVYILALKGTLKGMNAYLSRAIFWGIPFYCGIVENYTFKHLPIDRLTPDDLNEQNGAWIAVGIIACIVVVIAVGQAYVIWRAGKFWPYITGYITALLVPSALSAIPSETLRIHHYILALLFLPGTGFQTTPSLVYSGLLTGLFIAGVARWDFDSIIQTYEQLKRGPDTNSDDRFFLAPFIQGSGVLKEVILNWKSLDDLHVSKSDWNGFSLLINDVERYRGDATSFNITDWAIRTLNPVPSLYYLRIALANTFTGLTDSFTMAAVLNMTSGEWTEPLAGKT